MAHTLLGTLNYQRPLATRFDRATQLRSDSPLSDDQIARVAPSVFAESKHDSRSARYAYISTGQMLQALRQNGFQPFAVCQAKTRLADRQEFTKHMLRLRHPDTINAAEAFEVTLINSHDGACAYQMMAGLLNFVCFNGLVCGREVEEVRVRHTAKAIDEVVDGAFTILERAPLITASIDAFKSTQLTIQECQAFARGALQLKYDEPKDSPIVAEDLLTVRHREQADRTLWNVMNVAQENLIRGGLRGRTANGRNTTTRPVNGIDGDVKLNRALWTFTSEVAKLKAVPEVA